VDTVYDWVCLGIFAGLIVLFLERSMKQSPQSGDSLILYLAAGVFCAVANYFGNHGQNAIAIAMILGTVGFIFYFLKPFRSTSA